jgi:hypothetical protein
MPTVRISYDYDIHEIGITADELAAIKRGDQISIDGQGFFHEEDGEVQDYWEFNKEPGEIYFWLDNGAEFYAHEIWFDE